MAVSDFIDRGDRWELRVAGGSVYEICASNGLWLSLNDEAQERSFKISVEAPLTYVSSTGAKHRLVESKEIGALLELLWVPVAEASFAKEGGRLILRFKSGALIEVEADWVGEPWEIRGPDFFVICGPSGGLAYAGEGPPIPH